MTAMKHRHEHFFLTRLTLEAAFCNRKRELVRLYWVVIQTMIKYRENFQNSETATALLQNIACFLLIFCHTPKAPARPQRMDFWKN